MKRLMTLLLAAGLMFGATVSNASAVTLEAGGQWQFGFFWSDAALGAVDASDTFKAKQRIRPEFRFVADENLQGVLQLEIGTGDWGNGAWGMGADSTSAIKFRYGYVDWVVPSTSFKVRMGMQYAENALATFAPVIAVDVAGIAVSGQLCDNAGLTLAWYRPFNGNTASNANNDIYANGDAIDLFYAAVPMKFEGFEVTPWGMYMAAGKNIETSLSKAIKAGQGDLYGLNGLLPAGGLDYEWLTHQRGNAYWLGFGAKLNVFDPLTLALDFNWGRADFGSSGIWDCKRAGWQLIGQASYATDYVTPSLVAWYASGDDSNPYDGSERLPTIYADAYGTTFGMDGSWTPTVMTTAGLAGTWGVGLWLDNISFVKDLTHSLRATYYKGTNSKSMIGQGVYSPFAGDDYLTAYMTTGDSAWEFTLDSNYQVYKNLTASWMMGYVKWHLDDAWKSDAFNTDKNSAYRVGAYMTYKF